MFNTLSRLSCASVALNFSLTSTSPQAIPLGAVRRCSQSIIPASLVQSWHSWTNQPSAAIRPFQVRSADFRRRIQCTRNGDHLSDFSINVTILRSILLIIASTNTRTMWQDCNFDSRDRLILFKFCIYKSVFPISMYYVIWQPPDDA